jgi:hypothetical protein
MSWTSVAMLRRLRERMGSWLVAGCLLGCGDHAPERREPEFHDPGPLAYRPCEKAQKVGDFRVELAQQFAAVSGSVASEVVAADVPELVRELAGCRLERQRSLFCDPACGGGLTCGEGGSCVPYPENLDVGSVSVWGLVEPVHMEPDAQGRRYWDTDLAQPGFAPGADIHLQADGGSLESFTLRGFGVTPLEAPPQTLELVTRTPLTVRWQRGPAGPAHVQFTLNIDQHGVTPLTVVCDAPDTGQLTVPAELVTALFEAGPTGFPSARLERRSADSAILAPGCVEFSVRASLDLKLAVTGHMPCARNEDCLAGQHCDVARGACE